MRGDERGPTETVPPVGAVKAAYSALGAEYRVATDEGSERVTLVVTDKAAVVGASLTPHEAMALADVLSSAAVYAYEQRLPMPEIDAEALSEAMKPLVLEDVGKLLVPADVASFTDLHDYVDANEYLIQARETLGLPQLPVSNADAKRDDDAAGLITEWLAAGRPAVPPR
jgi:hypothetical protein